jgi:hypothetical protein
VHGHLTYANSWRGNNLITHLLGNLNIQFYSPDDDIDQTIQVQLPEFVLSNYINVDGKARVSLINGPLVLYDKAEQLKSVTIIKGLVKKRHLFSTKIVANTDEESKILDGIIYKSKQDPKPPKNVGDERHKLENLKQLQDVETILATVDGYAIDRPVIGNVPYSDWAGTFYADPIPAEIALPSDVRFREDLICLKRGEKGKGKVWMQNLDKK